MSTSLRAAARAITGPSGVAARDTAGSSGVAPTRYPQTRAAGSMAGRPSFAGRALRSAGWASLFAGGALLALGARRDPRAPWAPINVAAHGWWPRRARHHGQVEPALTAVALVTHVGACGLWAAVHEAMLTRWPVDGAPAHVARGLASALLADVVDYGLMPERATPGWEHELSRTEMAAVYGALGLGLAMRGLLARRAAEDVRGA